MFLIDFIKISKLEEGIDESELPISPGTKVTYNGVTYEAIYQGPLGWYWNIASGSNPTQAKEILFHYNDPIYNQKRDNSNINKRKALSAIGKKNSSVIKLPHGITTADELFHLALTRNSRLPEYEGFIAKNPEIAARYAAKFDFRFDKYGAEQLIAQNPSAAAYYAINVLKHRWPEEVENVIKTDQRAWGRYSLNFNI